MQKHVNLVDLVKSFPTNIYLQNLASIQKRTSPVKFAHLFVFSARARARARACARARARPDEEREAYVTTSFRRRSFSKLGA